MPFVFRGDGEPEGLTPLPATGQTSDPSPVPVPSLHTATRSTPTALASGRAGSSPLADQSAASATPSPRESGGTGGTPVPTPTPRPSLPPPARSCHVSTAGLAEGESRSCAFTATVEGGWRNDPPEAGVFRGEVGEVLVRRNGKTTRYVAFGYADCADDIIEPGDVVTVTLRQTSPLGQVHDLGAGDEYGCYPSA